MTDHTLASLQPSGGTYIATCVCGQWWARRWRDDARTSHTKHAAEMARVAARRPSKAEQRAAVEGLHEPLFGDES